MLIDLHPNIAKNLLDYLLNAKKKAEYVVSKKEKYSWDAIERAQRVVDLLNVVCNALQEALKNSSNSPTAGIGELNNKLTEIEKKIGELISWKDQVEVIIKKLVAYHSGDIK